MCARRICSQTMACAIEINAIHEHSERPCICSLLQQRWRFCVASTMCSLLATFMNNISGAGFGTVRMHKAWGEKSWHKYWINIIFSHKTNGVYDWKKKSDKNRKIFMRFKFQCYCCSAMFIFNDLCAFACSIKWCDLLSHFPADCEKKSLIA